MSKSRRKSNGCTRGRFKRKRMGKGWLTAQKPRGVRPIVEKSAGDSDSGNESSGAEKSSSGDSDD